MQPERHIQNLALIGFMGTGKSSVGHQLADQLRFRFVDTDALIVERAGVPITTIFEHHGEAAFRDLERQVVAELCRLKECIISTGGGLAADDANLASLKTHALVVCLWASAETIFQRVGHATHRPLLNGADPQGRIRELLARREPFYKQADVLVNTEMRSVKEVTQHVFHQFQSATQKPTGK